jgi:ABC-type nitrate/sulfonate/bicarbonate transport system permease component
LKAERGRRNLGRALALPALLVGAWWLASGTSALVASVLPPPDAVMAALAEELIGGRLPWHVASSLLRAVLGFAVAVAIGVPLGLLMGTSPTLRAFLSGPVELLRPISPIAWIPLAILWFGIGITSVVFVIFIVCVFIILINTIAAVAEVDSDLVKAARTLGAGPFHVFFKVVVPSALPGILLGLRVAMTGAWGGVIVAEMIAAQNGIGFMIHHAQITFRPELVIGGMVVIGVVGYVLNDLFRRAERALVHDRA